MRRIDVRLHRDACRSVPPAGENTGLKHAFGIRLSICLVFGLLLAGSLFSANRVVAVTTPRITDLTVTDQVSGGNPVDIAVRLNVPAPAGGVTVQLASTNSALQIQSTLSIGAGHITGTTVATTTAVGSRTKAVVSASAGGATSSETVVINSVRLKGISAPATINHGDTAAVTVTLTAAAPNGGLTVRLVGNRPSVLTVPASVAIPAGSTSGSATVTAATHRADAAVTLTAKLSGSANAATVTTVLGTGFPGATPTVTSTAEPTSTNTPEPTETNTPESTATNTPEPTATNTPEPTATNTEVPTATNTPEPTATNTPEPTPTPTMPPIDPCVINPAMCDPCIIMPALCDPCIVTPWVCDPCIITPWVCDPCLMNPMLCDPCFINPGMCGVSLPQENLALLPGSGTVHFAGFDRHRTIRTMSTSPHQLQ